MKKPIIILSVILLLGLAVLLIAPTIFSQCSNVYTNDFEFICCGETPDQQGTWNAPATNYFWKCPPYATKCEVSVLASDSQWSFAVALVTGDNSLSGGYFTFAGEILYTTPRFFTLQPNQIVYPKPTIFFFGVPTFIVDFKVYRERLAWCGTAGCDAGVTGIPVLGADGCTFITDKNIYNPTGTLKYPATETMKSYTVPAGSCYLAVSGRHVSGDTCEYCSLDTDCKIGHTLTYDGLGAECSTGKIELYGCRQYQECIEKDLLPDGTEYCVDESTASSRCEVIQTIPVQCCPNTDTCGTNAFCNPDTFTCQQQLECQYNWECGQAQFCDRASKTIKARQCVSGSCENVAVQNVQCCVDQDCQSGWYCSVDYTCKEKTDAKTDCPFQCCAGDSRYWDKMCGGGEYCCGDNTCSENLSCDTPPPPPFGIDWMRVGFFGVIVGTIALLMGRKSNKPQDYLLGLFIGVLLSILLNWLLFETAQFCIPFTSICWDTGIPNIWAILGVGGIIIVAFVLLGGGSFIAYIVYDKISKR